MTIRFYHWWIYHLYRKTWNPILRAHPMMAEGLGNAMLDWVKQDQEAKAEMSMADNVRKLHLVPKSAAYICKHHHTYIHQEILKCIACGKEL